MMKFLQILFILIFAAQAVFAESPLFDPVNFYGPNAYTIFSNKYSATTPFRIKIGSTKYFMLQSRDDGNYTYKDLLGCDKVKKQLFVPFYDINIDGDKTKLTADELLNAGIRFVPQKLNGKLELSDTSKDLSLDEILYIDMTSLGTYADSRLRPYGRFTMYMKTERGNFRKYTGHVEYTSPTDLQRMF